MDFNAVKRSNLEQRLDLLIRKYDAVHKQYDETLNSSERIVLTQQIESLESEISKVQQEIAQLEEGGPPVLTAEGSSQKLENTRRFGLFSLATIGLLGAVGIGMVFYFVFNRGVEVTNVATSAEITPNSSINAVLSQSIGSTETERDFAGVSFAYIPQGSFVMGSNEDDPGVKGVETNADEIPARVVELDAFWIMQTEVTNDLYRACVEDGTCPSPRNDTWSKPLYANRPVTNVSWNDALAYAGWFGERAGRSMRLPTEAEWEKACRGEENNTYPWGEDLPDSALANFNENVGSIADVMSYPSGGYGLYDMAGNAWEWTLDWYDEAYYASAAGGNPAGPEAGTERVVRGGSWNNYPGFLRCADRPSAPPSFHNNNLGFRLVSPE